LLLAHPSSPAQPGNTNLFRLSEAFAGDTVWIVSITAGNSLLERLVSMGLNRGTEVTVITRGGGGSVVVAAANARLALAGEMADAIHVCRSPFVDPVLHETQPMTAQSQLRDLEPGSRGRVSGFREGASAYRQQLLAMGLTPGTEFTVIRQAPLGDPVELDVRGFKLSLRKAEADALIVECLSHA
jgi:ferrous iron transport protein A